MRYERVHLSAIAYELAPVVVTTDELEDRLAPVLKRLHVPRGQLEALTGIAERRWWDAGFRPTDGAIAAAREALQKADVPASALGVVLHAGVYRELFEPATACRVADALGVGAEVAVYDVSNACLGVLTGILDVANRIELGQIRAGIVVSCETAREIVETTIARLTEDPTMERFTGSVATMTGGSGAVAVVLTDGSFGGPAAGRRLEGGVSLTAPEHHALCRWGIDPERGEPFMRTDAPAVLEHGVALGKRTWDAFCSELSWTAAGIDRVICHQVGSGHRDVILTTLGIDAAKDFSTFAYLGNTGTVALPITAAIADERGFLERGQRVGFLGIGSGLNCLMLGLRW